MDRELFDAMLGLVEGPETPEAKMECLELVVDRIYDMRRCLLGIREELLAGGDVSPAWAQEIYRVLYRPDVMAVRGGDRSRDNLQETHGRQVPQKFDLGGGD